MRKVLRTAVLVIATLLCIPSFAQKKTVAGYYIAVQGDTVKGKFPGYSEWNNNPSEVEFFDATTDKSIKLTPNNCQKFVVEGHDEYRSYMGQRLVNPISDQNVLNVRYSNFGDELDTVVTFLRLVTRTPSCELFVFADRKRTNFFYRLPGDSMVELRYKKYIVESEVDAIPQVYIINQINTITEYRDQLNNLFTEAIYRRKLTASLKRLPYSEAGLERFLEQLFAAGPVKHRQKSLMAGWVASIGTSHNFIDVKADKSFNVVAKEYSSSISPLLSIGYIAPMSRNFSKCFLYQQLSFFSYKNTGELNDGTFKKVTTYQTDLVVSGEANIGLNVVNQQHLRLYLAGGAGMMAFRNNKRLDVKYLNTQASTEPYRSEQTSIALKATPSINASGGLVIKNKLLVMATYLLRTQIDNVLNYTPRYSGFQFRIGYKLK